MATNLFSQAAAYRKKHPGLSQAEAVSLLSKKNKKSPAKKRAVKKAAAQKRPARKKAAAVGKVPKKKVAKKKAVRKKRTVNVNMSISGVSMSKISQEHAHQASLTTALHRHQAQLKVKGQKPAEKAHIRREIAHYRNAIMASKKHISALKRSI